MSINPSILMQLTCKIVPYNRLLGYNILGILHYNFAVVKINLPMSNSTFTTAKSFHE